MDLTDRPLRSGELIISSNMERSSSLPEPSFSRRRRGPIPDYSSRRSQFKLLVLVFALLAMLRLMDEVRRPENWQWFVAMQPPGETNGGSPSRDVAPGPRSPVDTRPPLQADWDPPDEPVIRGSDGPVSAVELWQSPRDRAAQNALLDGWTIVWARLSNSQQNQLSRGLWTHRQGRQWDDRERFEWPALVDGVRDQWVNYLSRLKQNLDSAQATLTPAQQEQCREAMAQLERTQEDQVTVLRAVAEPTALDATQSATLDSLQKTLDARAWNAVEDNTVLRSSDNEAWNRAWELVASSATTTRVEPVTFVQLFAQSKVYRGRAVQVQGIAQLGYHVVAHTKRQGIQGYYVLWLRPADGGESPLAIYVESLPPGFPPLAERTSSGEGTPLREEVTVAGLYFKRWLYGSQGGPNLAPLIIGTIRNWSPSTVNAEKEGAAQRSAPAAFLLAIAALFAVCGLVGWIVSKWPGRRSGRALHPSADGTMPSFETTDVRGSVHESLRALPGEVNDEV